MHFGDQQHIYGGQQWSFRQYLATISLTHSSAGKKDEILLEGSPTLLNCVLVIQIAREMCSNITSPQFLRTCTWPQFRPPLLTPLRPGLPTLTFYTTTPK